MAHQLCLGCDLALGDDNVLPPEQDQESAHTCRFCGADIRLDVGRLYDDAFKTETLHKT